MDDEEQREEPCTFPGADIQAMPLEGQELACLCSQGRIPAISSSESRSTAANEPKFGAMSH
jgi:hypothetical protein